MVLQKIKSGVFVVLLSFCCLKSNNTDVRSAQSKLPSTQLIDKLKTHIDLVSGLFGAGSHDAATWLRELALRKNLELNIKIINLISHKKGDEQIMQILLRLGLNLSLHICDAHQNNGTSIIQHINGDISLLESSNVKPEILSDVLKLVQEMLWLVKAQDDLRAIRKEMTNSLISWLKDEEPHSLVQSSVLQGIIGKLYNDGDIYPLLEAFDSILSYDQDRKSFNKLFSDDQLYLKNYNSNLFIGLYIRDVVFIVFSFYQSLVASCEANIFNINIRANTINARDSLIFDSRADDKNSTPWFLQFLPDSNNPIMNLIDVYSSIQQLPIDDAIKMLDDFFSAANIIISALDNTNQEQQPSSDLNNIQQEQLLEDSRVLIAAEDKFVAWLKSKWTTIPLTVGVIIIKTVYYFWLKEKQKHAKDINS